MRTEANGFTLLEVVLALFLISVGVIASAPLFVYASQQNAVGADLGRVGAAAVQHMELIRGIHYNRLALGGSLTANVTDYSDTSDPNVTLRWTIADNPNPPALTKVVTVRAIAIGASVGREKDVTLIAVRGR